MGLRGVGGTKSTELIIFLRCGKQGVGSKLCSQEEGGSQSLKQNFHPAGNSMILTCVYNLNCSKTPRASGIRAIKTKEVGKSFQSRDNAKPLSRAQATDLWGSRLAQEGTQPEPFKATRESWELSLSLEMEQGIKDTSEHVQSALFSPKGGGSACSKGQLRTDALPLNMKKGSYASPRDSRKTVQAHFRSLIIIITIIIISQRLLASRERILDGDG